VDDFQERRKDWQEIAYALENLQHSSKVMHYRTRFGEM
jgi:hypothetical protein